jgi:hypothetical protein
LDPGGLKRVIKEAKTASRRQIIRHKKEKRQYNWY